MTELSFAKQFLLTLEKYPTKISPDHVEDPKKYPLRPSFNLPKHTRPPLKKRRLGSSITSGFTVHLTSRNPPFNETLLSQSPNMSILDIKNLISNRLQVLPEKIKLLHKKKPVANIKILSDLTGSSEEREMIDTREESIDLNVMILGGIPEKKDPVEVIQVSTNLNTLDPENHYQESELDKNIWDSEAFWLDLEDFIEERLRDKFETRKIVVIFKDALKNTRPESIKEK